MGKVRVLCGIQRKAEGQAPGKDRDEPEEPLRSSQQELRGGLHGVAIRMDQLLPRTLCHSI